MNFKGTVTTGLGKAAFFLSKDFYANELKYIKATLNDSINGAIIFPAKTTHEENYLEFIAKDKLRDTLNLKDGDEVTLEI